MGGILADEIRRALFGGSGNRGGGNRHSLAGSKRREEWTCPVCTTTNFLDRAVCRYALLWQRSAAMCCFFTAGDRRYACDIACAIEC